MWRHALWCSSKSNVIEIKNRTLVIPVHKINGDVYESISKINESQHKIKKKFEFVIV